MENNRTQHSILKINRYSFGLALPKWMAEKLNLEAGERVNLEFDEGERAIIISKINNTAQFKPPKEIKPIDVAPQNQKNPTPALEPYTIEYSDSEVIPLPEL